MIYLEIVEIATDNVIKRVKIISGERMAERVKDGMSINLNHSEYFINTRISEEDLPSI